MEPCRIAYDTWKDKTFPSLTIDDILMHMAVTHKKFRRYVNSHRLTQPGPSPGLINEVLTSGMDPAEATRQFKLSQADVQVIYYRGLSSRSALDKVQIKKMIDDGLSNEDIAIEMNCTGARISQIRKDLRPDKVYRKRRNKLSTPLRKELKSYAQKHGAARAAEEFNVALATAYRILGE